MIFFSKFGQVFKFFADSMLIKVNNLLEVSIVTSISGDKISFKVSAPSSCIVLLPTSMASIFSEEQF